MPYQDFDLKPSQQFIFLIMTVLIGSLTITVLLPLNYPLKLPLFLLVLGYGSWLLWQYGLLKSRQAIQQVRLYKSGHWQLRNQQQIIRYANLTGDSTITRWVSVLRFQVSENPRMRSCIIFSDALRQEEYRQLRVSMRFSGANKDKY